MIGAFEQIQFGRLADVPQSPIQARALPRVDQPILGAVEDQISTGGSASSGVR